MGAGRQHKVRLIVDGQVQGVGFRQYTQYHAQRLGLVGYVKNKRDHTVEVVAEGLRHNLNNFIEILHEGPPDAVVRTVNATFEEATGRYGSFSIET
jgi:acylphosphatase